MSSLDRDLAGVGALADPLRRRLYQFVCRQPDPITRDEAAHALDIARHQAKFHLDRLEAEGLLETDYVRLGGRSGPGAGRPSKRYRRGRDELNVTIPPRAYELVGQIMAEAITEADRNGTPVAEAVVVAAAARGAAMAGGEGRRGSAASALDRSIRLLGEHGYEPTLSEGTVVLTNCPFSALARSHTELVCGLNHALVRGLADTLAPDRLDVRLEPGEQRCCVTLRDEP
jgi:predicted ArsR family transcriptional regulator